MADKNYLVGGIGTGTNFEIGAKAPIDSRFTVLNAQGLNELLTYEGLISYNGADKTYYQFVDGTWKPLSVKSAAELEEIIKGLIATETTGAMVFQGVTAALPENPGKGDMYKVAGDNINIVIDEVAAKAGDTIIYNGEKWTLIPSGDDIEDTWRKVIAGGNELGNDETLEFVAGENVTITEDGGKVTISSTYEDTHYESKLVVGNEDTDASDENVVENGNIHLNLVEDGVVKSSHKIVGAGGITVTHATGEDGNVITIEAPEGAKYDLTAKTESGEAILSLAGTDNTEDKVAVVGDDAVTVTVADGKIKVSAHDTKYTGSEGEEIKVVATDDGAITAELTDAVRTKLNKVWEEVGVAAGLVEDLAEGQVKSNKEAIEAINDETTGILAKTNAEIAKDRERLSALEAVNHNYADADAKLKAELQKEIDDDVKVVSDYVGTFTHATAKTVVEYINAKTDGIATSGNLDALGQRVTAVEGDVATIKGDYLKAADIANFETKENVQKVANDLAAETKARTDVDAGFETRIAALEGNFGDGEGTVEAQIAAAVDAEKQRAEGIESGLRTDVDDVTGRMDTAEGEIADLKTESAKHAIKTEVDAALLLKADKSVVDAMYTNDQIDGFIADAKKYADDNDADTKYGIAYDSENKKIKLVEGGSEVEIDASAFIKDGMISDVTFGTDNDLVITFNTDAGKEDIVLPLDRLVDVYEGRETDTIKTFVGTDHSISAWLIEKSVAKKYLDESVQASLELADSAIQSHQDISHLATTEALNGVDAKFANYTNTTDMNAALDLKADKTQVDTDIAAAKSGAEAKAVELDAALKTELQKEIDDDVKALADTVYTKPEVEALLTWGSF